MNSGFTPTTNPTATATSMAWKGRARRGQHGLAHRQPQAGGRSLGVAAAAREGWRRGDLMQNATVSSSISTKTRRRLSVAAASAGSEAASHM